MADTTLMLRVASELDLLSGFGEPLSFSGQRSTMAMFDEAQRVKRNVKFAREYLSLQPSVARDGRAVVVTAGPPGAGKSTALRSEISTDDSWRNVDADLVKELILREELRAETFSDLLDRELADGSPLRPFELATLVHRESVSVAASIASACIRRGENIVIQGTLGWEGQPTALLDQLRSGSYGELTILDVEATVEVAKERAVNRWWEGRLNLRDPLGGRFTPSFVIEALFDGGGSKCRTNATLMFEKADFPTSQLITVEDIGGLSARTRRQKYDNEEFVGGQEHSSRVDTASSQPDANPK